MSMFVIYDYEIIWENGQESLFYWQLWPIYILKLKEKYSVQIIPIHIPKTWW